MWDVVPLTSCMPRWHRCAMLFFTDGYGAAPTTTFPIYPQEYIRIRPDFVPQRYGQRNGVLGAARFSRIAWCRSSTTWDYRRHRRECGFFCAAFLALSGRQGFAPQAHRG